MEKTDTRFHHASGKDTPLLVDTRMATFLHKKRPGLSHLFQCTERPSTVPPVPDGKIFGSGRFLLLEQCRRRHRNRRLLPDRTRQYGHRSHPDRQRGQYFTKRSPDRIRSQLPGYHSSIIEQGITTSPIHIGEHTIIGANVIVLPGITIGQTCLYGAGCVVTRNIPDFVSR